MKIIEFASLSSTALRDRSPNTEEGGPGEKWGARKIIWVSRGGGAGKKCVVQRGGPQKKQDYHKYSGTMCQIP